VPSDAFLATFTRAVALDPDNRGVAFLTPVHPLVRAVLQRVRVRLYDSRAQDRVAAKPVAGTSTGWLFTATGRIQADDGRLLEEPLIPVFIPRLDDGTPGPASQDEQADTRWLRVRPARVSGDPGKTARDALSTGFDAARQAAMAEAARRLAQRAQQIRDQLAADAQRLTADLDRWRQVELAEAERRFATGPGDAVQLSLFADTGYGAFHTMDEARKIVEEEFTRRREALQRGFGVAEVTGCEPVGCLLCVEAAGC
jgi:hypothetical protein